MSNGFATGLDDSVEKQCHLHQILVPLDASKPATGSVIYGDVKPPAETIGSILFGSDNAPLVSLF